MEGFSFLGAPFSSRKRFVSFLYLGVEVGSCTQGVATWHEQWDCTYWLRGPLHHQRTLSCAQWLASLSHLCTTWRGRSRAQYGDDNRDAQKHFKNSNHIFAQVLMPIDLIWVTLEECQKRNSQTLIQMHTSWKSFSTSSSHTGVILME